MKKSIMMAAMLLMAPGIGFADDTAWGDVGGGSVDKPATQADAKPAAEPKTSTCGQDDPRMQNLIAVLKDIKAGKKVAPLQMSFGTYMGMSPKIRKILGDNIVVVTASCKKQFVFDGELTGKVEMPFPEAMNYINDALRARDKARLNFVFATVKAAPDTLHHIMSYSVARSFPLETGKVLVQAANIQPVLSDKKSMGILLLNLYQVLGGHLATGEKNTVIIHSLGQFSNKNYYIANAISSSDKFTVTVGSAPATFYGRYVTDMLPSHLREAFSAVGISSSVTK